MAKHEIDRPMKAKGVVHKRIADIAKGCAAEQWEKLAKQNRFYKRHPQVQGFVDVHWPKYVDTARAILTAMLGNPKYDQATKDEIFRTLQLDGAVNPKKMANAAPPKRFMLNN